MDWFLCDKGLRHERVNKKLERLQVIPREPLDLY